jgi:hypothetical protein
MNSVVKEPLPMRRITLGCLFLALACQTAKPGDTFNGSWYEFVPAPNGISWTDAKLAAEAAGGHLATVTSPAENDFIVTRFPQAFTSGAWLGGDQPDGTIGPANDWRWVTGEPWNYANWAPGEPNDWMGWGANWGLPEFDGKEDALHYAFYSTWGTWNDSPKGITSPNQAAGYVLEKSVPEGGNTLLMLALGLIGCVAWSRPR